ncbi:MAG TPA: DNA polymerase IV [Chitinophagaceae bacterium]|jgi:DNA polymerase-4|nr:DNA polymerase IV [Chitinophagaceae bacterium]
MEGARHIVHFDLDTFFVSVERLQNSSLMGKPVIVGGYGDRAVVASCSYEARMFGVHSAMPMRLALQLCPDARVIKGDMDVYSRYSHTVTEIISEKAPIVEKASIDEHYLDISGMDKFFGCWKWSRELRQRIIKETGLPISFGLSPNKTVSKIATGQAKPNGEWRVETGGEKSFLAPLSVKKIPGVGDKTFRFLSNRGIQKIITLQQMPADFIRQAMGKSGVHLWQKANGIDGTPVMPYTEQKSMSKETTFGQDTTDMEMLRKTLIKMVGELAFELRSGHRLTACLTVKIRYANFDTYTRQARIPYSCMDEVLLEGTLNLFYKLYNRRMLVRLIGVKLSQLVSGSHQIDLFNDTLTHICLYQTLDKIRNRFGKDAVVKAVTL